jgi:hypothetical protein
MASPQPGKVKHVVLVLLVFTFTGTTTAWLGRQLSGWLDIERFSWGYWLLWIVGILPIYNVLLPLYGWLFGKHKFFRDKQRRIWRKITRRKPPTDGPQQS